VVKEENPEATMAADVNSRVQMMDTVTSHSALALPMVITEEIREEREENRISLLQILSAKLSVNNKFRYILCVGVCVWVWVCKLCDLIFFVSKRKKKEKDPHIPHSHPCSFHDSKYTIRSYSSPHFYSSHHLKSLNEMMKINDND